MSFIPLMVSDPFITEVPPSQLEQYCIVRDYELEIKVIDDTFTKAILKDYYINQRADQSCDLTLGGLTRNVGPNMKILSVRDSLGQIIPYEVIESADKGTTVILFPNMTQPKTVTVHAKGRYAFEIAMETSKIITHKDGTYRFGVFIPPRSPVEGEDPSISTFPDRKFTVILKVPIYKYQGFLTLSINNTSPTPDGISEDGIYKNIIWNGNRAHVDYEYVINSQFVLSILLAIAGIIGGIIALFRWLHRRRQSRLPDVGT